MRNRWRKQVGCLVILGSGVLAVSLLPALGMSPAESPVWGIQSVSREFLSSGGTAMAELRFERGWSRSPKGRSVVSKGSARARVYRIVDGGRELLYEHDVSNIVPDWIRRFDIPSVFPLLVADDGQAFVIIDSGYAYREMPRQISLYSDNGYFGHYSFRGFLGMSYDDFHSWRKKTMYLGSDLLQVPFGRRLEVFIDDRGRCLFCAWIPPSTDDVGGWYCVDVTNGQGVQPDEQLVARLNELGRQRARAVLSSPTASPRSPAIRFLGHMQNDDDRALLEAEMRAGPCFTPYRLTTPSKGRLRSYVTRVSVWPYSRHMAAQALALWDGLPLDQPALGKIELHPQAPDGASKNPGLLCVYLFDESVRKDQWTPQDANLTTYVPLNRCIPADQSARPETLTVELRDIAPGEYWVLLVWDAAEPRSDGFSPVVPGPGDYVSGPPETFEVVAGEVVNLGEIAYDALVADSAPTVADTRGGDE